MSPSVTLFAAGLAPNPLKVAILLEELGIEYEVIHEVLFTLNDRSELFD